MSYSGLNPSVRNLDAFGNPFSLDMFGRQRTSNPFSLNVGKQAFDSGPLVFDTAATGSGVVTYVQNEASTRLTVGAAVGTAIRQTHLYQNYQPGKSQLAYITFHVDAAVHDTPGYRFRVGYFDAGNGFFLELIGGGPPTVNFVLRTNATGGVTQTIPQTAWNFDRLDGTSSAMNPSGKLLNLADRSQVLVIAFEALFTGTGVMGFFIDGRIVPCHFFDFANENPNGVVYMQTANLPVRWELEATAPTGGTGTVNAICCSVISEGGEEQIGNFRSANRGASEKTINTGILEQVIAIRLGTAAGITGREPVVLTSLSAMIDSAGRFCWEIRRNPAVTGAAVWQSIVSSPVEFDIAETAAGTRVVSVGQIIASGYAGGAAGANITQSGLQSILTRLGSDIAGVRDTLVLAVRSIDSNEQYVGGLNWFEYG